MGIVTRQKLCQRLAPSMRAASYSSPGMPAMAASTMSTTNGVECHTSATMTQFMAANGSLSQGTYLSMAPSWNSSPLSAP